MVELKKCYLSRFVRPWDRLVQQRFRASRMAARDGVLLECSLSDDFWNKLLPPQILRRATNMIMSVVGKIVQVEDRFYMEQIDPV
jgi:hypothetical protein